jgi:hypothetical protein
MIEFTGGMLTSGDSGESGKNPSDIGEEDWYQQLGALVLEPPPYKLVPEQVRVNKWP